MEQGGLQKGGVQMLLLEDTLVSRREMGIKRKEGGDKAAEGECD